MIELKDESQRKPLSGWPMLIGWIAMILFALHASTRMVGAGDTWVAMACGRHFINHGVDTVEPFSANSHEAGPTEEEVATWPNWAQKLTDMAGMETVQKWHPTGWINQNWLTHVIFYWLSHLSPFADADQLSFNSLVYWKFSLYILTVICVYYMGRLLGVNPFLSAGFACFAMFVSRTFLDIRPAGYSNLLVPVFLLILILAVVRNKYYIWLLVPVTIFWSNVHGGYIYVFIMLVPFLGMHLLLNLPRKWRLVSYSLGSFLFFIYVCRKIEPDSLKGDEAYLLFFQLLLLFVGLVVLGYVITAKQERLFRLDRSGLIHAAGASFAAFLGSVIFNPFHLTNFTHTFIISVSENAEMWRNVNEWHPAFEFDNPVGDSRPFLYMYIIAWGVLIAWTIVMLINAKTVNNELRKRKEQTQNGYSPPNIDITLIVIAVMTIYMAIRSRRFITIAAYAACPIIAMLIDQMIRNISAVKSLAQRKVLKEYPITRSTERIIILMSIGTVLIFGVVWGLKFKYVYLDPWHTDERLTSVFMRMTASHAKPFDACQFIRDNELKGNMFNYWTEGGFIAWGQNPDPETGKTPLQLFMDGRAQAAYDVESFDKWGRIMSGGRMTYELTRRKRKLTASDYAKIGQQTSQELRENNVWVFLMPRAQFDKPVVKGFEANPEWPIVFMNKKQKMFVDITTPQGKALFDGIVTDETAYPDEFSKHITMANLYLKRKDTADQGLYYAVKAFEERPCDLAIKKIFNTLTHDLKYTQKIAEVCHNYLQHFENNKKTLKEKDGYYHKLTACFYAAEYLEKIAQVKKRSDLIENYRNIMKQCSNEINRMQDIKQNRQWW